jgi:hypothetical protein
MKILAIDPSGSFEEGKGQTGWVVIEDNKPITFGILKAKNYETKYEYWEAHSELFKTIKPDHVVMEQYRLYGSKAKSQINSEMETSKLLGYLEMNLYTLEIEHTLQSAVSAKSRFTDVILIHKGYITKDLNGRYYIHGVNVAGHIIDAMRHALFYQLKERKK